MRKKSEVSDIREIGTLLFSSPTPVRVINLITIYRIVTFPLLIFLIIKGHFEVFKWLLLASFLTDAIDGFLARRYNAASILGAKLDSIGDDLTVLAAAIGLFVTQQEFVADHKEVFIVLFALFLVQVAGAIYRYGKISTFHTWAAKTAAVVSAVFLLSVFFLQAVSMPLFIAAAVMTGIDLLEEIILVAMLRDYRSNVKGLYWVIRHDDRKEASPGQT